MRGESVFVVVDGEKREIGVIRDDLFLTRKSKKHYVRKYNGFGIALEPWKSTIVKEVDRVKVIYHLQDGTQEVYTSSVRDWEEFGVVDQLGEFEEQVFLSTSHMEKKG